MTLDITKFQKKLEEDKKRLETELSGVSVRVNPKDPENWEAAYDTPDELTETHSAEIDPMDVAETIGNYEKGFALNQQLEEQLNRVKHALDKIKDGTYGMCDKCNSMIPLARLEANPAAVTCMAHSR
ncbi:MAG: TraR/DksA C4-type zinc finger protein [Candidatus Vogelbacteria bacterium]|nr:TraR/DksA C4-type zinc finger protein [Candidatus Vogelbacteria bacterium]